MISSSLADSRCSRCPVVIRFDLSYRGKAHPFSARCGSHRCRFLPYISYLTGA